MRTAACGFLDKKKPSTKRGLVGEDGLMRVAYQPLRPSNRAPCIRFPDHVTQSEITRAKEICL